MIVKAPGDLPLLGHLVPMMRNLFSFLSTLPTYGDLVEIRTGRSSMIVVTDPDLTREILRNDDIFDKGGAIVEQIIAVIGDGVGTHSRDDHRRRRQLVQSAFHRNRFPDYGRMMVAQIDTVTNGWHDGELLDVKHEMTRLSTRILVHTMFSGALPQAEVDVASKNAHTVVNAMFLLAATPGALRRLPIPAVRRARRAASELRQTAKEVIANRRSDDTDHGDLLSALLAPPEDGETGLTDAEIVNQLLVFFTAGSETTGTVLSWALHLIASHPDIENRVYAELDAVLAGEPPNFAQLPRLELLGRVINETLRLYPSAWTSSRIVTSDTVIGGHSVTAGTTIMYSPYLLQRRKDMYDNADRFDPDRWEDPRAARSAYMPFGAGARKCLGDQFALIEITLALASILSKWRLHNISDKPVPFDKFGSLAPRLTMRLSARTAKR